MLLFLSLLDTYRIVVTSSGDRVIPQANIFQNFKGLQYRIGAQQPGLLTVAHVFFATSQVWRWMANLLPQGETGSGFYERVYLILKNEAPPQTRLGMLGIMRSEEVDQG